MRFAGLVKILFGAARTPIFWALFAAVSVGQGLDAPALASIVQQMELTASDGVSQNYFGDAVALNATGNIALVGAIDGGSAYTAGAAYVYVRTSGVWSEQTELIPSDATATDRFGDAVALSEDGNTAIIGAPNKHIGANSDQGAAYIFRRNGSSWVQQQELLASDGAELDGFGVSVALSSDGNTALVGAWGKNSEGAAYIFKWNGSSWTQQAKLTASDAVAGNTFGLSVSLSGDGTIALVGDWYKTVGANSSQGAAYVFKWNGAAWVQQQELTSSDGAAGDVFSAGLAISRDGSTIIAGSPQKKVGANVGQGAAYIFKLISGSWTQQQELTSSDGAAGNSLGRAGSLSSDGKSIMISAPGRDSDRGAAYLFQWNGAVWVQQQTLTASDGVAGDNFGGDLAVSSDGTTALSGARAKHTSAGSAAYVFVTEFNIIPSFTGNGSISCSPNPAQAHSDSVCTIAPTNSGSDFFHVSEVLVAPVGYPFWITVDPTTRYVFSDIAWDYYMQVTFDPTDIWLCRNFLGWTCPATANTITESFIDAGLLALGGTHIDEIRLPGGAFADSGAVSCVSAINPTLSGGWSGMFSRNTNPMSTIAGPLTITGSCRLAIDGITIE